MFEYLVSQLANHLEFSTIEHQKYTSTHISRSITETTITRPSMFVVTIYMSITLTQFIKNTYNISISKI